MPLRFKNEAEFAAWREQCAAQREPLIYVDGGLIAVYGGEALELEFNGSSGCECMTYQRPARASTGADARLEMEAVISTVKCAEFVLIALEDLAFTRIA